MKKEFNLSKLYKSDPFYEEHPYWNFSLCSEFVMDYFNQLQNNIKYKSTFSSPMKIKFMFSTTRPHQKCWRQVYLDKQHFVVNKKQYPSLAIQISMWHELNIKKGWFKIVPQ